MGNRSSIAAHVGKEIERLNEMINTQLEPGEEPRRTLVLDQLPKLKPLREQELRLDHVGVLFVLDKGLKGFFDERDFLGLAETCLKRYDKWREQNFQQQLQAYCTLQMWHVVCGSGGDEIFARWFGRLLEASSSYQVRFEESKRKKERALGFDVEGSSDEDEQPTSRARRKKGKRHVKYVRVESVHTIHKLLLLEELYGMSRASFVGLCLEAAEEKHIPMGEPDTVPLPVLKDFAIEFVRGLTRLMHRLGFKRDTIVAEL